MEKNYTLIVNGETYRVQSPPDRSLLEVLREDLHRTGTKYGCGHGQCGACTVLVEGRPVLACVTRIARVAGKSIRTIEGLAQGQHLHVLQEAFLAEGAAQCGYCTSGMIMRAMALLEENPHPTVAQICAAMNRNICRCNNYAKIVKAIQRASSEKSEGRE